MGPIKISWRASAEDNKTKAEEDWTKDPNCPVPPCYNPPPFLSPCEEVVPGTLQLMELQVPCEAWQWSIADLASETVAVPVPKVAVPDWLAGALSTSCPCATDAPSLKSTDNPHAAAPAPMQQSTVPNCCPPAVKLSLPASAATTFAPVDPSPISCLCPKPVMLFVSVVETKP